MVKSPVSQVSLPNSLGLQIFPRGHDWHKSLFLWENTKPQTFPFSINFTYLTTEYHTPSNKVAQGSTAVVFTRISHECSFQSRKVGSCFLQCHLEHPSLRVGMRPSSSLFPGHKGVLSGVKGLCHAWGSAQQGLWKRSRKVDFITSKQKSWLQFPSGALDQT